MDAGSPSGAQSTAYRTVAPGVSPESSKVPIR